jgi:FMN reductase (NADPH)
MKEIGNSTIDLMMNHRSVRKYTEECPSDEMIRTIVLAGQQAAFAYQGYSFLMTRKGNIPFKAPLLFTICVDIHKFRIIAEKRDWVIKQNDIALLLFGLQDANLALQNMILAAESFGLGTCLLGNTAYVASKVKDKYKLPDKVFPFVQMTVGYPDEMESPRPRYPLEYTLFEDQYPDLTDPQIESAMEKMDRGYMDQEYYRKANAKIKLPEGTEDKYTFDNYGWTEHISRKMGLWLEGSENIRKQLKICGFDLDK